MALVVLFGLAAALEDAGDAYVRALLGGLAAFAFFLTVHLIAPRGMGFGDVKLSFCLGVALGWLSWGSVFLGLFLGFLLGAVVGVALIATGTRSRKDHVPFGPFLAAGTVLAIDPASLCAGMTTLTRGHVTPAGATARTRGSPGALR